MAAEPTGQPQDVAAAITEVSERMTLLVREEIELAKAEVATKLGRLARGAVIGMAAGIFVVSALLFGLHGLAWLLWYALPFGNSQTIFWGFFVLAAALLLVGSLAGYIAFRAVRRGSPPTPQMAIDEARKIRETVSSSSSERR